MTPRLLIPCVGTLLLAAGIPQNLSSKADPLAGTRLAGLRTGPHAVGFEVLTGIDASRRINAVDAGTRIGMAVWYPARAGVNGGPVTALDYQLLDSLRPVDRQSRRSREDDLADALVAWRHIGIVEQTPAQARAALATRGIAVRTAPAADGRFPVVVVAGGPYYLSTTAEVLATHGFLVVAAFRYADQSNEIGTASFTWYVENAVRDAEWALAEMGRHPHADVTRVAAIGHGGGGMTAMLLAMRNRAVDALVNIDAGNFSSRSEPEKLTFFSRRLLTAPYLYIATADTRKTQDRFDDFLALRFSDRIEVVLDAPDLRHHDLSDFGRAVTAPLGIRGEPQAGVQQASSDVHEITVRFLLEQTGRRTATMPPLASWLETQKAPGRFAAMFHAGAEPAPTVVSVIGGLDATTPSRLREARQRDPDAPVFAVDGLGRIVIEAMARGERAVAAEVANLAVELHPGSAPLLELSSQAFEAHGDRTGALQRVVACAAIEPGSDWRASGAVARCRETAARLRAKS
jgi:dienelactone hydrolase